MRMDRASRPRCRYYTGEGWVPKKLDVLVEAPESLSLEHLRATGLQPGSGLCPRHLPVVVLPHRLFVGSVATRGRTTVEPC